jgi:hypothetical protein
MAASQGVCMSNIKERPILFSAPMVRAILDGRKTVTRRPVKGLSTSFAVTTAADESSLNSVCWNVGGPIIRCPYGKPGDRLYVRETFNRTNPGGAEGVYYYRADGEFPKSIGGGKFADAESWKPSIHMPRAASRILLEITHVRVERLQDISEGQAVDEGLIWEGVKDGQTYWNHTDHRYPPGSHQQFSVSGTDAVSAFRNLWKSTGGDWEANPWVWVVEFKRVTL